MSSIDSFNKIMTHTITIIKRQRTKEGNFKNIASYPGEKGFCQYGNKLITLKTGEEVMSTTIIFLKNDSKIDINHEYWLINQTSPYVRSMEVLQIDSIDNPVNKGEIHHYEVIVR